MDGADADGTHRVCSVEDIADGDAVIEDVEGTTVAVVAVEDDVYAIENVCPHQGGPIGEGKVEDGCIYCPWHGWQFDLATGEHVHGMGRANTYPVSVEDGDVYVTL